MKTKLASLALRAFRYCGFWPACSSVLVLTLSASYPALGDIIVTDLHPPQALRSYGSGVSALHQVGYVRTGNNEYHATLWSGTAASSTDLNPGTGFQSYCYGVADDQQVGWVIYPETGYYHAALWTGNAESFQDFHPSWALGRFQSYLFCTTGSRQGGEAPSAAGRHATIWSDSASSALDLNPASAVSSTVRCMTADQQAGVVEVGEGTDIAVHAALWSGVAGSMIDLHPPGFYLSEVYAMTERIQAGEVQIASSDPPTPDTTYVRHAALWSGTPESFVDMHPASATGDSVIMGACGRYQVGWAYINDCSHAGLWSGTPGSFVDLHAALGTNFSSSVARAVWTDGSVTRVVGNTLGDPQHAILWTITPPRMDLAVSSDGVKLSWSSNELGFTVERTTTLDSVTWDAVTNAPSLANGKWMLTVPFGEGSCYSRLRKQ